jgi:methyl-accepting chemotaxis protein-1 (serine sensor receptor)
VAKDVIADILPPPMYLIEVRLVLSMMMDGSLPAADGKKRFDELAAEYAQRVDYWTKNPPFGLEAKLLGAQHTAAKAFIAAAHRQIVEPMLPRTISLRCMPCTKNTVWVSMQPLLKVIPLPLPR